MRFQAILRLWPTTARFCCQPQVTSWLQSSWKRSWTNGLFSSSGKRCSIVSAIETSMSRYLSSPVASQALIR